MDAVQGELKQERGRLCSNSMAATDKILGMLQERHGGTCASLVLQRYGEKKEELMKWATQWRQQS